jgi:hypothetical protein
MKHVDASEWRLLKQRTSTHLTDPSWLGGAYCVSQGEEHGRVQLPMASWDAVALGREMTDLRD